jgi:hypothetical protein
MRGTAIRRDARFQNSTATCQSRHSAFRDSEKAVANGHRTGTIVVFLNKNPEIPAIIQVA